MFCNKIQRKGRKAVVVFEDIDTGMPAYMFKIFLELFWYTEIVGRGLDMDSRFPIK